MRIDRAAVSVAIVQTVAPDYRVDVFRRLAGIVARFTLVAGEEFFDSTVTTAPELDDLRWRVKNRFFLGRRFLWQSGHVRRVVGVDVAVLEMNPRILSNWALLALRALGRRPTLVWGHAVSRERSSHRPDVLRRAMMKLASGAIVYTETEAASLRRQGLGPVFAAPNAVFPATYRPEAAHTGDGPPAFVYVGRLVETKKPQLLLRAFLLAAPELPGDASLTIVGEGPKRTELEEFAATAPPDLRRRITFLGHRSDRKTLERVYATATASVSPGYVGLSLIQSLYHGVPMIIARGEPHSPEIEAAHDGDNAVFFKEDSVEDLARALVSVAAAKAKWAQRCADIANACRSSYSAEAMADRMSDAVQSTWAGGSRP